jgi:hypothetical protein
MSRPIIFVLSWFVLSLIQASLVNLTSDEGYYWFYTKHLQWGYYDHPPVIALMISAGYSIFTNEMGVRLLNIVMMSGSILLFFYLLPARLRNSKTAFILLLSQPLLHYFSIIVFPDGPLIFFSLLFLLGYKRWLERNDLLSGILMGLALAGMFYSKYHGLLILVFTVFSNMHLLRSRWFWLAVFMALLLALPHLYWQLNNGWPSLQYHFQKRTQFSGLNFHFIGEYISQQLPAFGPAFLFGAITVKNTTVFERTLRFVVLGTLIFFLCLSLIRFIHFHWTSVAIFPAAYLAVMVFEKRQSQKLLYWLTIPFIIIILIFRMHIVCPFIPLASRDIGYYAFRDRWAAEISQLAGDRPVVFVSNFRDAGLYSFYSGKIGIAVFKQQERRSQYDLWGYEDSIQGKPAMIIEKLKMPGCKEISSAINKNIYYRYVPHFQSYFNIAVKINQAEMKNDSLCISVSIINTRQKDLIFYTDPAYGSPNLFYQVTNERNELYCTGVLKNFDNSDIICKGMESEQIFILPAGKLNEGDYWIEVGFKSIGLPESINTHSRVPIKSP